MRLVALGRKNWIHIRSPQSGPKVAAILSVVESCRRLKLLLREYPPAVLSDLPICRSSGSHTLLTLRGSPSIHRLKRLDCWREGRQRVQWDLPTQLSRVPRL
jgi:hypothetical protein